MSPCKAIERARGLRLLAGVPYAFAGPMADAGRPDAVVCRRERGARATARCHARAPWTVPQLSLAGEPDPLVMPPSFRRLRRFRHGLAGALEGLACVRAIFHSRDPAGRVAERGWSADQVSRDCANHFRIRPACHQVLVRTGKSSSRHFRSESDSDPGARTCRFAVAARPRGFPHFAQFAQACSRSNAPRRTFISEMSDRRPIYQPRAVAREGPR